MMRRLLGAVAACLCLLLLWKGQQVPLKDEGLQSCPGVISDLDSLAFVEPYASKSYADLRLDLVAFLAMYDDTFVLKPDDSRGFSIREVGSRRQGPLPQLYALRSQMHSNFMDMECRLPDDLLWENKVQSVRRRTLGVVQAYIEDVRERLQLSRYEPGAILDVTVQGSLGVRSKNNLRTI